MLAVTGLVIAVALRGDHSVSPMPPVIAYVGYATAQTDKPYAQFRAAVRLNQPQLFRQASFEYIAGSDSDDAALALAVRAAARRRPAVIVTPTGASAAVARREGGGVSIVFATYADPVRDGYVASMRAPGGHITGVSLADALDGKRMEILHDAFPAVRSVGVLADRAWAEHTEGLSNVASGALRQGLVATILYAESAVEVDRLMASDAAARFDAWYVPPTYVSYQAEAQIAGHLKRLNKPSVVGSLEELASGGRIAYVQDTSSTWVTIAELVARVVAGEDAGTIPIERPRKYRLAVRVDAADGSQPIAPSVVRRADLVY